MARLQRIGIVGGGFSGTMLAYHLERLGGQNEILIIEPRAALGLGLAYSTSSMRHLLNVSAGKISALPDHPRHFIHWSHKNYDPAVTENDFLPRAIFGRYVQSFASALRRTEHVRTQAIGCNPEAEGLRVHLGDSASIVVDRLVLALGNFEPAMLPRVDPQCETDGKYSNSAWCDQTFGDLPTCAPVLLIGTGLTAVDVLLRLREQGHRGIVTAVSRHGIFPSRHEEYKPVSDSALLNWKPKTARELLERVRRMIAEYGSWRGVIDCLRACTNDIWQSLPESEQLRFRRHLLRRWEVLRHRMAPSIADHLGREFQAGTLIGRAGRVVGIRRAGDGAHVDILDKEGTKYGLYAQRVINCTGPDMNYGRSGGDLMKSLLDQKLITPGRVQIGLWTDDNGAARNGKGRFSHQIFALGPARLGTLLESIAVPELRQQALQLAGRLSAAAAVSHSSESAA